MGKSQRVDSGGSKRAGVRAARDVAGAGAGAHAADELDVVGWNQLSTAQFGNAFALGKAAKR